MFVAGSLDFSVVTAITERILVMSADSLFGKVGGPAVDTLDVKASHLGVDGSTIIHRLLVQITCAISSSVFKESDHPLTGFFSTLLPILFGLHTAPRGHSLSVLILALLSLLLGLLTASRRHSLSVVFLALLSLLLGLRAASRRHSLSVLILALLSLLLGLCASSRGNTVSVVLLAFLSLLLGLQASYGSHSLAILRSLCVSLNNANSLHCFV